MGGGVASLTWLLQHEKQTDRLPDNNLAAPKLKNVALFSGAMINSYGKMHDKFHILLDQGPEHTKARGREQQDTTWAAADSKK